MLAGQNNPARSTMLPQKLFHSKQRIPQGAAMSRPAAFSKLPTQSEKFLYTPQKDDKIFIIPSSKIFYTLSFDKISLHPVL